MPENSRKWPSLVAAVFWTLLAVGMAVGIIWALPDLAPLPMLIFGVCLVNAFVWWSTFFRARNKK